MKTKIISLLVFILALSCNMQAEKEVVYKPWDNGKLIVSENRHYLEQSNGTPFFWLGDTGWLMPERLNRDEVEYYLNRAHKAGYNVVQVQVLNQVPSMNVYGQYSMIDGYKFDNIERRGVYGYWDNMDYILDTAEQNGIYIGMVCIWGSMVKAGKINVAQAEAYGKFLAERYKNHPNIIWMMGGDIRGDVKPEIWNALATTIKKYDPNHLMTFHPLGRTTSALWFNGKSWLDFNMFQSGHRRYGQTNGDGDNSIKDDAEEDNWRYVENSLKMSPLKPVLDGEPSYEDIPQGLHDTTQPRWQDYDVRRYAYWSVFAGSLGHTYGHNSIMQFMRPGVMASYGADKPWYDALNDPGYNEMKYLKNLILTFPFFERVPDQSIVSGRNGERYNRLIATRGKDYLLVYDYCGRSVDIDLTKISGAKKNVWWYSPVDGKLEYLGEFDNKVINFQSGNTGMKGSDKVLIAVDADKSYFDKTATELPNVQQKSYKK